MRKINARRLLLGGLFAGVALSAIDVAMYGAILKAPMALAWQAAGRPTMTDIQRILEVPPSLLFDFVMGLLLVWIYVAIRPRFGPGVGTALKAALAGWALATTLRAALAAQGIMPFGVMVITALVLLVEYPIAVVIGAKVYAEGSA